MRWQSDADVWRSDSGAECSAARALIGAPHLLIVQNACPPSHTPAAGDTLQMAAGGNLANRTRPTLEKRAKERARQEKRKQKEERRASAKAQKSTSPRPEGEEDPDIAGIV